MNISSKNKNNNKMEENNMKDIKTVALRYNLDEVFLKDLHPIDRHTPVELFAEFAAKAIKEEYEVEPVSFGVEVDFEDGHLDIYDIQI